MLEEAEEIFGEEPETDEITTMPTGSQDGRKPPESLTKGSITPKQRAFLLSLMKEKEVQPGDLSSEKQVDSLSKRDASKWISAYIERKTIANRRPSESFPSPNVLPDAKYAIDNEAGVLTFYKVWRHPENPGFVKLYLLHGPDSTEIPFRAMVTILQKIVDEGPLKCAQRFGREIKHCSRCGRRLTKRISRDLGIGPVCGHRMGGPDDWALVVIQARRELEYQGLDPDESIEDAA